MENSKIKEPLAPVILFVYNRLNHTKNTVQALSKNNLCSQTDLFVFSDAAKSQLENVNVTEVRNFIDSITELNIFKSVTVYKAKKNKGLANSVVDGVTKIIKTYKKAIVLEDDLITSQDFLQFMNEALDFYKSNAKIWSISGYTFSINIPENYKYDIYASYRACSWGWATWEDRWNSVDWKVSDYYDFCRNRQKRKRFNRGGNDLSPMLHRQMRGEIDSWAIKWCYEQSKQDKYTIYPIVSRVENIGLDGSGTHSGITHLFDTKLNCKGKCSFQDVNINKEICINFKKKYGSSFYNFLGQKYSVIKKHYH